MRVLHLTPEFPPVIWGGLGTAVGGLATASAHEGLSIGVLLIGGVLVINDQTSHPYGAWQPISLEQLELIANEQPIVNSDGVTFFHVAPEDAMEAGIRLVRMWKPDVIHLHTAWFWPVARAIKEQTGIPLVFTVHSLDRAEYEIGDFITHWDTQETVIAAADRVIALTRSERDLLYHYCPEARDRIRIVGNGIDDTVMAQATVRREKNAESPVILYSGRFVDRKGIRELLLSIPQVLEKAPEARFVLVGGYGSSAEMKHTWLNETLQPYRNHIHFTGWLVPEEVAAWYRTADILVMPSWYEPFGMVILEGMLHGLAIASTDVGGPMDILEHERTALLFPPKDVEALTETLLRLIQNPSLRHRLGAAAADEVRCHWLWRHVVPKMEKVYLELTHALTVSGNT